jgi:RNA polymerase sigma factor (sigma-70 family)
MAGQPQFHELIDRARRGDQTAATLLVRQVQPELERFVQGQLSQQRLSALLDPADISQTVLYRFFLGLTNGRFQLAEREQLTKLVLTMARNQILDEIRKHRTQRRDLRRQTADGGDTVLGGVPDPSPTPSRTAAGRELIQEMYRRLTDDERDLVEARRVGQQWAEIAASQGGNAEALRKKLSRAMGRVTKELGMTTPPPSSGTT